MSQADTSRNCSWTGRQEPNIILGANGSGRGVLVSDQFIPLKVHSVYYVETVLMSKARMRTGKPVRKQLG